MAAIEKVRDQGAFRDHLRRLLKESETKCNAEQRLTLLGRALVLAPRGGEPFTDELLGRVVPLLDATERSTTVTVRWLQADLLERAVQLAVVSGRKDLVKDLTACSGRWLKELAARDKLHLGARQTSRVLRILRAAGLRQEEGLLVEEGMSILPVRKNLAALRERYADHWPEALSVLVGLAGVRLGSGKAEEAAPILDEARAILFARPGKGSEQLVASSLRATLACASVAAVGQGLPEEAFTRMKELLEKMPPLPDSFTIDALGGLSC
jgi:hypothetical protein